MVVPPVTADRSSVPIEVEGREVATIVYDASLDDDPEMLEAVRAAAAMALENEALLAESDAGLAEVQASRHGSSPPATPSAAGSSATSTTARSSGSSRLRYCG